MKTLFRCLKNKDDFYRALHDADKKSLEHFKKYYPEFFCDPFPNERCSILVRILDDDARGCSPNSVPLLLQLGMNPDQALQEAAISGFLPAVLLLLTYGADASKTVSHPYLTAYAGKSTLQVLHGEQYAWVSQLHKDFKSRRLLPIPDLIEDMGLHLKDARETLSLRHIEEYKTASEAAITMLGIYSGMMQRLKNWDVAAATGKKNYREQCQRAWVLHYKDLADTIRMKAAKRLDKLNHQHDGILDYLSDDGYEALSDREDH